MLEPIPFAGMVEIDQINNEPVVWTDGKGNYFDKNSFFPVDDLMPLYTHPSEHDLGIAEAIGFDKGYQAGLRKAQEK
jgi:hypothetical protein